MDVSIELNTVVLVASFDVIVLIAVVVACH